MYQILMVTLIFIVSQLIALPKEVFSDCNNPTKEDLRSLQEYLDKELLKASSTDYSYRTSRVKAFKLFDENRNDYELHIRYGTNSDKSCCVICYVSINSCYEKRLERLLESLEKCNFSGDVLYRIGGWPNMEDGGLSLSNTAYAFKVSAFEEALRLGYKQVLWLDSSVIVLKDLTPVFQKIKDNGSYFRKSFFPFNKRYSKPGGILNKRLAKACGMSLKEMKNIPHCSTVILGLNLEDSSICQLLQDWHLLAEEKESFKASFVDQISFSALANRYNLYESIAPLEEIGYTGPWGGITQNTIFVVDYKICSP